MNKDHHPPLAWAETELIRRGWEQAHVLSMPTENIENLIGMRGLGLAEEEHHKHFDQWCANLRKVRGARVGAGPHRG